MVLQCLGPDVPQVVLVRLREEADSLERWEVLEDNAEVARMVAGLAWPKVKVSTITTRQACSIFKLGNFPPY